MLSVEAVHSSVTLLEVSVVAARSVGAVGGSVSVAAGVVTLRDATVEALPAASIATTV